MIKDTLLSLPGVEIYPIISLIIFVIIFTIVVIWTFSLDKKVISEMESIPLDNDLNDGDNLDVWRTW